MAPIRVLFVCTHNGARSRIAEEFAKRLAAGSIQAHSASFEADTIGALPVSVMREVGIELETTPPKSVFDRFKDQEHFDYVITICDPAGSEQVPVFEDSVNALYDATARRETWAVRSFRSLRGTDDERRSGARDLRDRIRGEVLRFLRCLGVEASQA